MQISRKYLVTGTLVLIAVLAVLLKYLSVERPISLDDLGTDESGSVCSSGRAVPERVGCSNGDAILGDLQQSSSHPTSPVHGGPEPL